LYPYKLENKKIAIGLLCICSTMMILKIKVFTIFFIAQVLLAAWYFLMRRKVFITQDFWINAIYLELFLSTILAFVSSQPASYRKAALILLVLLVPMYFTYSTFESWLSRHPKLFQSIKKGLVISLGIELVVCLLQFLAYKGFGLDLNKLIFQDLLNLTSEVSQYKSNIGLLPSGLCWHSAFMGPVCVFAFLFTNNLFMALLAIVCAVICSNTTALLGMVLCVALYFYLYLFPKLCQKKLWLKKGILLLSLLVLAIGIAAAWKVGIFGKLYDKFYFVYGRIFGTIHDSSAQVHMSYYTDLPSLLARMDLRQILFGYGLGSSGLAISNLTGQYADLANWSVESDVIDLLLSRGILGFALYYGFLFYIAFFGSKMDIRYGIAIVSLAAMGITYNIQFDWVFFVEMLMLLSIKYRINLFDVKIRGTKNET
jgi:hypothetical protein